ncbi:AbrB/MazE/SpoVT family DNA-binding domain-containing protein [Halostagnicola bangensis]
MTEMETQRVGSRGQVTIPKELREASGIQSGDEVEVRRESGRIIIEKPISREELAEGYRRRAKRTREMIDEMKGTSREANVHLDDAPECDDECPLGDAE